MEVRAKTRAVRCGLKCPASESTSRGARHPLVANLDASRYLPSDMIEALGEPIVARSGTKDTA